MEDKNFKVTLVKDDSLGTQATGGAPSPPDKKTLRIDFTPIRAKSVTWKYIDGTPAWAVQAAIAMGYEVEKI